MSDNKANQTGLCFGLTTAETMDRLKISRATLSRLSAAGKLTARKAGSRTIVDAASIETYWNSLPVATYRAPRGAA